MIWEDYVVKNRLKPRDYIPFVCYAWWCFRRMRRFPTLDYYFMNRNLSIMAKACKAQGYISFWNDPVFEEVGDRGYFTVDRILPTIEDYKIIEERVNKIIKENPRCEKP